MTSTEVAVVGAGPVGLLLACLLAAEGVDVIVLERRQRRSSHSRSIGVHPPALEVLAGAQLAGAFLELGVRVERGHAYSGRVRLGTLAFSRCPPPYPFVLTLPQVESERLLEARLRSLPSATLRRGAEVERLERPAAAARGLRLRLQGGDVLEAAVVVGCDGVASVVREQLGIPVRQRRWPDRFVMGDVPDGTAHGRDAAIYLTRQGVVESFPLPAGLRRWVAAVPGWQAGALARAGEAELAAWLEREVARLGERFDARRCSMVSAFGVHTRLARRLACGRAVLAGDAAHALPPFGGQGMNLGWLDAAALAEALLAVRAGAPLQRVPDAALQQALAGYERARSRAARDAAARAAFNLRLGRAAAFPALRDALLWAGLRSPLAPRLARRFTMRGLEDRPGGRSSGAAVRALPPRAA